MLLKWLTIVGNYLTVMQISNAFVFNVHRSGIMPYILRASIISNSNERQKTINKFSNTVLLPTVTINQRANPVIKEPEIQEFWHKHKVFERLALLNSGRKFILHDGPPYANGNLHIGHALNKILKDFIVRYQLLKGKRVQFVPGWDCHGLPIELKVLQNMNYSERCNLTPIQLRKRAANYAMETVQLQKESFQRYGVWADWDAHYLTMQPDYEAAQIRVFGSMVKNGYIFRSKKPVHWSPSSRTALAEAELEYADNHVSKSAYIAFKVTKMSNKLSLAIIEHATKSNIYKMNSDFNTYNNADENRPIRDICLSIWTTTPWTIPANLAIAVHADINYCIASHPDLWNGTYFIVAEDLVSTLSKRIDSSTIQEKSVDDDGKQQYQSAVLHVYDGILLKGADLIGTQYQHPLYSDRVHDIILGGDYITAQSGTGLVHTAPGHGYEDYLTGLKYNLPLLSPVDDAGCFTDEAGIEFAGLNVLKEGNSAVIAALQRQGALIKEEPYPHKYPYDWRTKKPTILRATEQWFASVATFREEALAAMDTVEWLPSGGKQRISGMVAMRGDWCISRQRAWGIPIPVFYRTTSNSSNSSGSTAATSSSKKEKKEEAVVMTAETIAYIADIFAKHGSNAWWEWDTVDLLPPDSSSNSDSSYREAALRGELVKGTDTMDVWFDSGTSWAGVLQARRGGNNNMNRNSDNSDAKNTNSNDCNNYTEINEMNLTTASDGTNTNSIANKNTDDEVPAKKVDILPILSDEVADLYLEGSDQHRGWFQSSLLTSVASRGCAPYKTVLTHGFVLDEKGFKMSKSLGNVVDPALIIQGDASNLKAHPAYGADTLRLWVSAVDYTSDVCLGNNIIRQVSESYRKLRNTLRYLLGSISTDFQPNVNTISYDKLPNLDKYILHRLSTLLREIEAAYESHQYFKVNQLLLHFCANDLSSFYLEVCKDRLYISNRDAYRRRSCQTVLATVLEYMVVLLAPILPHLAEEVWQMMPNYFKNNSNEKCHQLIINSNETTADINDITYSETSSRKAFPTLLSIFQKGWIQSNNDKIVMREAKEEVDNDVNNNNNDDDTNTTADHVTISKKSNSINLECNDDVLTMYRIVLAIRSEVNKCMEIARRDRVVGSSMDSRVVLHCSNTKITEILRRMILGDAFVCSPQLLPMQDIHNMTARITITNSVDDLRFLFVVSEVEVVDTEEQVRNDCPNYCLSSEILNDDSNNDNITLTCSGGSWIPSQQQCKLTVGVTRAFGKKCDRCWYFSDSVGKNNLYNDLCDRCAEVMKIDYRN